MRIALIASESNPYCKSGGLADVVYSLAKEFNAAGHEAIIILPHYQSVQKVETKFVCMFEVTMNWRHHTACIYEAVSEGVKFYFIGEDYYFTRHNLYGYGDDGERFAFFSLAAKKFLEEIDIKPDVVHVHDWQSAIIPMLIQKDGDQSYFKKAKTVLTIHNPAFAGLLDDDSLYQLFNLVTDEEERNRIHIYDKVSTLKAGIVYSDAVTTVSPTHAKELTQGNAYEIGDALVEKGARFIGVVNGVDLDEFDPSKDDKIAETYTEKTFKKGKKACKTALFESFGLQVQDGPLFVLVSRLYEQKGIPLVLEVSHRIVERGGSLLVLGSGEFSYCQSFEELGRRYPGKVGIYVGYSQKIAHACYAGGDFFLMPSLFEPCGISQMIAQRYGCLPIARDTGGLHDTIIDHEDGFLFRDYDYGGIRFGVDEALDLYYDDPKKMEAMQVQAMKKDHSWKKSAAQYLKLFDQI